MLPITLTIAGAAALVALWLAIRTGQVRRATGVLIGDGGDPRLVARLRAQANFIEYTPLILILIGLIESAWGSRPWLWLAGIVYILGRVLHPFGMDRRDMNALRGIGAAVSMLALLGLGIVAIVIAASAPHVAP